jgi:hypothetical protein
MTFRLSTGARNLLVNGQGLQGMFNKGYIEIYTGSQPASADAAKTGTLLGVVTISSNALTKETRATGSITLATGGSGSINTLTVGGLNIIPDGAVAFNTSLSQTASDLCDAINRNGIMEASVSGAVVTLKGRPGTGVTTAAVTSTLTTITATYVNMGSGVAGVAPVNALTLGVPAAGVIAKKTGDIWSFNGVAAGTAGWFRFYPSDTGDSGAIISGAPYYPRMDGSVAVSGADLNLSNIAITIGAPCTVDTFSVTMPAS